MIIRLPKNRCLKDQILKFKNLILAAVCAVSCAAAASAQTAKKTNQRPAKTVIGEPFDKATVETMATQCVTLETEAGKIEIEMLPETARETVRNFLNLVAIKAFDTTVFSRVVPGFVIQGGDLSTRETLTTALAKRQLKTILDEPNLVKHERGIVSMARGAEPDSASTNFFILVGTGAHLDGTFAAFGRVTRGMEIADAISKMPGANEKPEKPVRITRAVAAVCPAPTTEKPAAL